MSGRSRRRPRGALAVVVAILLASGVIRGGLGVGGALARGADAAQPVPVQAESAPPGADCALPSELAGALRLREERVRLQEDALAGRMQALSRAEHMVEERLAALTGAEATLSETLARADGAAEGDLSRLTAVYEAMKPREAAQLFETMAPEFAAGFLGRMRPDAAAAVLSGMSPDAAYTVSLLLAGRNALVPRE